MKNSATRRVRAKARDRLTIMQAILNITMEGTLKTHIMNRANLSFAQLCEYLDLLQEVKLLETTEIGGKTFYTTTAKGIEYLEGFGTIRTLLQKARLKARKEGSTARLGNPPYLKDESRRIAELTERIELLEGKLVQLANLCDRDTSDVHYCPYCGREMNGRENEK